LFCLSASASPIPFVLFEQLCPAHRTLFSLSLSLSLFLCHLDIWYIDRPFSRPLRNVLVSLATLPPPQSQRIAHRRQWQCASRIRDAAIRELAEVGCVGLHAMACGGKWLCWSVHSEACKSRRCPRVTGWKNRYQDSRDVRS